MISVCSRARQAASSAAPTTKSVTVRPWISAARSKRFRTSMGIRTSRRAAGFVCLDISQRYGNLPYKGKEGTGGRPLVAVGDHSSAATANYLIGPTPKNLLRPARAGSNRSTCAFPLPCRRHRTRIRYSPESGTSCASTVAALPGWACPRRRKACSCLDSSCDP